MSDQTQCPKCRSTNTHVGRKGASLGKAVGGAVIAGPVGALAGLHGSGDIEAVCLNCGKKWNPVKYKSSNEAIQANYTQMKDWQNRFVFEYENGSKERATQMIKAEMPTIYEQRGLDGSYRFVKELQQSGDNFQAIAMTIIIIILGLIAYWILS